jgi:hypothetical protein
MILLILMLLIYLVIGVSTVVLIRSRLLDILRVLSGIAFLLLLTIETINTQNPDAVIMFALGLCTFISIEIAAFKETKGDRKSLFLIYAFTLLLAAVLIIMLLTL